MVGSQSCAHYSLLLFVCDFLRIEIAALSLPKSISSFLTTHMEAPSLSLSQLFGFLFFFLFFWEKFEDLTVVCLSEPRST